MQFSFFPVLPYNFMLKTLDQKIYFFTFRLFLKGKICSPTPDVNWKCYIYIVILAEKPFFFPFLGDDTQDIVDNNQNTVYNASLLVKNRVLQLLSHPMKLPIVVRPQKVSRKSEKRFKVFQKVITSN